MSNRSRPPIIMRCRPADSARLNPAPHIEFVSDFEDETPMFDSTEEELGLIDTQEMDFEKWKDR